MPSKGSGKGKGKMLAVGKRKRTQPPQELNRRSSDEEIVAKIARRPAGGRPGAGQRLSVPTGRLPIFEG